MIIYSVNLEGAWSVSSLFVARCLMRPYVGQSARDALATGSVKIDPLVDTSQVIL